MSRIGRMPIAIPAGVEVKIDGNVVTVKGAKATLTREFHPNMNIAVEGNEILVTRPNDDKQQPRAARPDPQPGTQHGCWRYRRLQEGAERTGRRLPCSKAGPRIWL